MRRSTVVVIGALVVILGVGSTAYLVLQSRSGTLGTDSYVRRPIGRALEGMPWVSDLTVVDLDRDGLQDVLVCDGELNQIGWIRQIRPGEYVEESIGSSVAGPAHVEVADMNGDGHLDVLVSSMGVIPPSNNRIGAVVVLVNDGANHFTNRVLLQDVARVTYVAAADFNQDGLPDLIVGQFGYIQGEIRWMENHGNWEFSSHILSDLPGTVHAPAVDLDGDGHMDVVALISQDVEEVHAFYGDGTGQFRERVLYGSTNRDYGSSGLVVADVNQDGRIDVVYSNGDAFDYATPGSRPWHGLQWLENLGERKFAFHRVGDFPGCYSPVVVDIDGDGDNDLLVCSSFNEWSNPKSESLLVFENDGNEHFIPRLLAHKPTHLIVVKAADMNQDGRVELVTGAMFFYPPYESVTRVSLWEPASKGNRWLLW